MRRDEALKILHDLLPELKARYAVRSLWIFGSVARDQAGPGSDLDVLVEFEGAVSFLAYMGLKETLEAHMRCPVDVATPKSLKPRLEQTIKDELLYVA